MGTNYYLQRLHPDTGRAKDIHICKTSGGWTPSMRGYRNEGRIDWGDDNWYSIDIRSWREWKWFLLKEAKKGGIIFNEYDEPIGLRDFFKHIERWQKNDERSEGYIPKLNHAHEARRGAFSDGEMDSHALACWIDDEGYSFHDGEFS